jgi:hypothetical protein
MNLVNLAAQRVKSFRLLTSFLFFLFAIFFLLLGKTVAAQIPQNPVDCDDTIDPEFHSLRPYQASPCKKEPTQTARFCGNRLVLTDNVSASRPIPPRRDPECTLVSPNTYRCNYKVSGKTANYSIDLSNASFPILGNTEKVINSQNQNEELDDAEKTNEYVSWYLNGVIGRAEYGKDEDMNKIVNFSGPLKKLLPQSIQYKYQIATIENREKERHDQIVVCAESALGPIGDFLRIGKKEPIECYEGDGSDAQGIVYRLNSWDAELSQWNDAINTLVDIFTALLPSLPRETIRESIANHWNKRVPPLPWEKQYENNPKLYLKHYNEWRGKTCVLVPIVNLLVCLENYLVPNEYADLFPYVPFSSTEDRVGLVSVDSQDVTEASKDLEIDNVSLSTTPAKLYFSHTEEVAELANLLQLTFVPQGNPTTGTPSLVSQTEACDITNIRSNEGDDLFATKIEGTLSYDAEFSCDFPATASSSACTKDISVGLSVVTETPKADEIWERLVAGPSAVFKRIFPKIDPEKGPIGCLLDIPGATGVVYSGSGLVEAGNPGARSGESAELYFPHVGGVYEYFLKGIQTILRPKGYGDTISYGLPGDPMCKLTLSTDICSGECNENPTDVDMTGVREKFMDLANRWLGVGSPRTEKFDQVVNTARSAGVDPIFVLAIWLHESGASNYLGICTVFGNGVPSSQYCQRIQDFSINREDIETQINASGAILVDNFTAQLNAFVNLPGFYISSCGTSGANCPMEIFGAMYQKGTCSANDKSNGYVAGIKEIYNRLAPGQTFPCYPSRVRR